ncbi:MAG: hypothetical protein Q9166_005602 [cf. Caloplaca sp. 2 TL-2023]
MNLDMRVAIMKTTEMILATPRLSGRQRQNLKGDCENQKGHWYLRHDGPGPILLQALSNEDTLQETLHMPGRYHPKLTSLAKHHDPDSKHDLSGPLKQSKAVQNAKEIDIEAARYEDERGGTRRVVFEENGIKVVFIDEEL